MNFLGAIIKHRNESFVVINIKLQTLESAERSEQLLATFTQLFPGKSLVLHARDHQGASLYRSTRTDLLEYLRSVPAQAIPWKTFALRSEVQAA